MSRSSLGRFGEEIAFKYLLKKGFVPKQRNFRAGRYEIDLIMEDAGGCVVFVEVKPEEAINSAWGGKRSAGESRQIS